MTERLYTYSLPQKEKLWGFFFQILYWLPKFGLTATFTLTAIVIKICTFASSFSIIPFFCHSFSLKVISQCITLEYFAMSLTVTSHCLVLCYANIIVYGTRNNTALSHIIMK